VYKIDTDRNLVYVKGHVPGNAGGFVRITDAVKGPYFPSPPPFPTYFAKEGDPKGELYAEMGSEDPLAPVEEE
jgi:large subunit ribosomal protein L3